MRPEWEGGGFLTRRRMCLSVFWGVGESESWWKPMMSCVVVVLRFSLAQGRCRCSASGTGQLVPPRSSPVGCLVAILVTSFALQSFARLRQSVLRCSWPGKGQKLFSPWIVKADIDRGNILIASSSQEACNTSARSVCRFHSAGNAHSPALEVGDYLPAS